MSQHATRFVAIVPTMGSAYHIDGDDLIQTGLNPDGGIYIPGPDEEGHHGEGAVDFATAFESDEQAAPVREIERQLRSLSAEAATSP